MLSPKRLPLLAVLWTILLGIASSAQAASVTLAWDPSNGAAGYVVLWGTSSGVYGGQRDVGNVTQAQVDALADGATYYFTVQAYGTTGLLSGPSSEVSATTPVPSGTTTTTNAPYLGFSGNGKPSLLMQNGSGALQLWALNGGTTASMLTPSPSSLASSTNTTLQVVGAADFNSDGSPDILIQDASTAKLSLWYMNGTLRASSTTFSPSAPPDANWKVAGVGDFNADRKPDILFQHKVNGLLLVWFLDGAVVQSTSYTVPSGPTDPRYKVVGVTDMNGDRKPDLVFQHAETGVLCVWFMNGTTWTSASLLTPNAPRDTRWKVVGLADMNGDQKPDVVLQHSATGQVCFWYMDGVTWFWAAAVEPIPASGWRVALAQ